MSSSQAAPAPDAISELSPSRRRFFFSRTLSSASTNSRASVATFNTILPQYSVENPLEATSGRDLNPSDDTSMYTSPSSLQSSSSLASSSRSLPPVPAVIVPPRYSYVPPRYSTIGSSAQDGINREISHHEHSFPIRANKPWATLHIFSRDPGELQLKAKLPRLWGGEPITGMVELDLESSTTIQQITITLRGKIVTGYLDGEGCTFLDHDVLIYHKSHGDPRPNITGLDRKPFDGKFAPGSYQLPFSFLFPNQVDLESCSSLLDGALSPFSLASASSLTLSSSSMDEKQRLTSEDVLFSYQTSPPASASLAASSFLPTPLPTPQDYLDSKKRKSRRSTVPTSMISIPTPSGTTTTICPTPPSFLEQDITASVVYGLVVHFKHGKLRPDSKLKVPITYIPSLIAQPASLARQQAYENATLVSGPLSDPEGWFALPTTVIQGEIGGIGGKHVSIECTLYLARSLSYTRGTNIPLHLHFASQDTHALSILCTPKTPLVRLVRRLRHFSSQVVDGVRAMEGSYGNGNGPGTSPAPSPVQGLVPAGTNTKGRSGPCDWRVNTTEVAVAVWWVPSMKGFDQALAVGEKWLEGEIHLPKDMKSTNGCALFSIEYFVELLPVVSHTFEPVLSSGAIGDPRNQVLSTHPVEIATLHPPGTPMPVAFTESPKTRRTRRRQTHLENVEE